MSKSSTKKKKPKDWETEQVVDFFFDVAKDSSNPQLGTSRLVKELLRCAWNAAICSPNDVRTFIRRYMTELRDQFFLTDPMDILTCEEQMVQWANHKLTYYPDNLWFILEMKSSIEGENIFFQPLVIHLDDLIELVEHAFPQV